MSMHYTQEFKNNVLEKLLGPDKQSVYKLSKTTGVSVSTLYGWKENCGRSSGMNKNKKLSSYSREQKLDLLIKISTMSENELGAFLRENGFHSSDLNFLREEIINGPEASKKPSVDPEVTKLRHDLKASEKELKRKENALAELAARITLLKKSQAIWGDPEDDK